MENSHQISMDLIVSLAKRRGFVFQSGDLYGGLGSVWDYGPYGALMKENIKSLWRQRFVQERDDVFLIDSSILTKREVLQASGHEAGFTDPLVECKICHERFRADKEIPQAKNHQHDLTEAKQFNLMFKTQAGPVEAAGDLVYLRPETAQGMFSEFANVLDSVHKKLPFGIAQIGKAFRNEITTGNFIFRTREFEQMEIEYFVKPGDDDAAFSSWVSSWEQFFYDYGLSEDKVHHLEVPDGERAHYSKRTIDLEYDFPFGREELAGIANRTDYDLKKHQEKSGKSLEYFDAQTNTKYLPFTVEPTMGLDRAFLAFFCNALQVYPRGRNQVNPDTKEVSIDEIATDMKESQIEYVLHLNPRLAPITVAVLPLSKKEPLASKAKEIAQALRKHFMVEYDETGSIGKRYRRQDEIGTPFCVTYDFESENDHKVTVRNRDTMEQDRVLISDLTQYIQDQLANW